MEEKQRQQSIRRLESCNPTVFNLLKDAPDPRAARNYLIAYIEETHRLLSRESRRLQPLEWEIQMRCLHAFRNILSVRSERLAGFSTLKLLWRLARGELGALPENLGRGFFEEMTRLFLGIRGKSGVYDAETIPPFASKKGREAAILRSEQLDRIAERVQDRIRGFPTGLDPETLPIREANRKRILKTFQASENDWADPDWHLKHVIRDSRTLGSLIRITRQETEAIDKARKHHIPFGITPYYASLMDRETHRRRDHAVRAQVIPPTDYVRAMAGHRDDRDYSFDFMLEHDTSPIDLITRRYPMIVILKPYNTCSQICVYCQRNWEIEDCLEERALAPAAKIEAAMRWIQDHPAVREVLVTGGDPLVMSDQQVESVLARLAEIDHVERIRIGSRVPVVLPMRVTDALADMISAFHLPGRREVAVVTHFEHVYEITPDALRAVQQFRKRGMSVYNQAVYTVENSRRFELVALRHGLRMIGVDPYYSFNTKGKEETRDYRVPLARLQQEIREEARLMPGLVRTDEAVYNVPGLGKNYLRAEQHHSLLSILADGRRVYEFHPWEKNLSLAETFIDVDVSITDYLDILKSRGEDPEDYRSVWYYY